MRVCAGLLQEYLRSHMGLNQDIMKPAHQAGCIEQFKMSGMLIPVTARSPVMAVTVVSPGSSPGQCDCSLMLDSQELVIGNRPAFRPAQYDCRLMLSRANLGHLFSVIL